MNELKIVEGSGLLDMNQACQYLNIKKHALYQLTMLRLIRVVKIGKLNRFRREDLERVMHFCG